jgi:hypothetical protein
VKTLKQMENINPPSCPVQKLGHISHDLPNFPTSLIGRILSSHTSTADVNCAGFA